MGWGMWEALTAIGLVVAMCLFALYLADRLHRSAAERFDDTRRCKVCGIGMLLCMQAMEKNHRFCCAQCTHGNQHANRLLCVGCYSTLTECISLPGTERCCLICNHQPRETASA
jgi:hypothetical protein